MSYTIEHYPTHLIDVWTLADGRRVTVRPVLPQDAALEQAMVRALSPASRYQRFFAPIRELPAGWLERLTQIDYRQHQALIVESFEGDEAQAVAEARYVVDAAGESCEFAVVVADGWQQRGLARRLLQRIIEHAASTGLQRMVGEVLATNRPMLELARSLGFSVMRHPDGGAQVVRVSRPLQAAAAPPTGLAVDRGAPAVPASASY